MTPSEAEPAHRRRSCDGSTLIEVVIASLLVAILTVPIMSAALGGRQMVAKTSHRLQAAADARHLAEALKAYVVDQAGSTANHVAGPGTGSAGAGGWALPGDTSGLNALDAGTHVLTPSVWVPDLVPYNGTVSYIVTVRSTPQGPQPDVAFNVQWTDL